MIRRVLLARLTGVFAASSLSALVAGCLSSSGPGTSDSGDSDGMDESDDTPDDGSDDADSNSNSDDPDPLETGELGDLDAVEEPDTLVVRNDGSADRELELTIDLESSEDDDSDLERTVTIPSDECLEIAIGDPDGFGVAIESDGTSAMTFVSHTDSSVSETRIVLTEG